MSPKNSLLHVGLTALGWFGLASSSLADPGLPAPPGQSTAAAPSPTPTVLSLTDGRVLQGRIQVDDHGYSVQQNGGVLRFRKALVEGAFGSLAEAYRFKAERVPARDPDEHLKLANWCLAHHLNAEAKAQLLAVLELSPNNAQIKDRLLNIDNAMARMAVRDEGLVRTRGERPVDGRPAELDAAIFRPGRGVPTAPGLPTVFDLPTPLAVKRADEFARSVHPVLQNHCGRCHNENYPGDFQLIQVKSRKDWTPNVARANLEAALRQIDPDSPPRSELLTRGLVPHGPYKRPIFRGAADPEYRRVAAWVNSLRPRPTPEPAATARFGTPEPPPAAPEAPGFATDRAHPTATPPPTPSTTDGRPQPPATPNPRIPSPPGQIVAGSGSGMQPYAPPGADFPVPYLMGGPEPKLGAASAPAPVPPPSPRPSPALPAPVPVSATADTALPALPVSPAASPATAKAPGAEKKAAPKPATKPVKVDPALLERALMNRYAPH